MPATTKSRTRSKKPSGKQNSKSDKARAEKALKAKQAEAKKKAEAARKAREEAKAKERQDAIKSGKLIEGPGDTEFHLVEREDTLDVEKRAESILNDLKRSKTPLVGRELMDKYGGGWPQYLSFFAMLKALGLVIEYRRRTGERGGAGVAYLHVDNA